MLNTQYRKYEFPNKESFDLIYSDTYQNLVEVGESEGKYYVDVLWTSSIPDEWNSYQIYPGIDTSHTFLGYSDFQYNTELNSQLALMDAYPHYINRDVTLIPMDNLHKLIRKTPVSTKGIKSFKQYEYEGKLVWSIESIYWFETSNDKHNDGGIVKIHKWYDRGGNPILSTERYIPMSNEDKEKELKYFRENAINYLKSANPELFTLLYTFFKDDIQHYINVGDKEAFAQVLLSCDHPIVVGTFSYQVPTLSGGFVSVLDGILYELL